MNVIYAKDLPEILQPILREIYDERKMKGIISVDADPEYWGFVSWRHLLNFLDEAGKLSDDLKIRLMPYVFGDKMMPQAYGRHF